MAQEMFYLSDHSNENEWRSFSRLRSQNFFHSEQKKKTEAARKLGIMLVGKFKARTRNYENFQPRFPLDFAIKKI